MDNQVSRSVLTIEALPPELLSKIFILAASRMIFLPPTLYDPQWIISVVCREWRRIVLQTPELWSSFFICIDAEPTLPALFRRFDMQARCIKRAGSRPLSFAYVEGEGRRPVEETSGHLMLLFVLPIVSRLSLIRVFGGLSTLHAFLSLPEHSMPFVEDVLIGEPAQHGGNFPFWTDECTALESCPKLRKFTLRPKSKELDILGFRLPWPQLTDLNLGDAFCNLRHAHSILQNCDALRSCQLGIALDDFPSTQPTTTHLHLSHLQTLSLYARTNAAYEEFLNSLVTPGLQNFSLSMETNVEYWEPEPYLDFFRRSKLTLRNLKLSVDLDPMNPATLVSVLRATPSLLLLDFPFGAVEQDTMERIASGELTPQLETLVNHYRNPGMTDVADLVTAFLLELREVSLKMGLKFNRVVMNKVETFTPTQTAAIAQLVAGGLAFGFDEN